MRIYVKYCGGCNPRYDREALLRQLKKDLSGHEFTQSADDPDVSLILCGCASACADKKDAAAPYGIFTLWNPEAAWDFGEFISRADKCRQYN